MQCVDGLNECSRKRRRRQWHPTPVLLPEKSHGQRSLVGCSPWGCEESDTTERLHFHFSLSCIGDGNDNLLQCYCLENPRDGRAWWAAVYGVTQSRTRLKRLSSSSAAAKERSQQWPQSFWHEQQDESLSHLLRWKRLIDRKSRIRLLDMFSLE